MSFLKLLERRLKEAGLSPREAPLLLAKALGVSPWEVFLQREIPEGAQKEALALLEKRLSGYPLQYLLGEWEFYGLPLRMKEGVLIPRPETEGLVEWALELPLEAPRVLDVGTGSGAIALAYKAKRPKAEVYATEVDKEALALAEENARRLGLQIHLLPLPLTGGLKELDLILSNPPYLPEGYREKAPKELSYENPLALYAGQEGLDLALPLVEEAWEALRPGGWIYLELSPENVGLLAQRVGQRGWANVEIKEDLTGKPRYLRAQRPKEG
ncbi:MAG: peptide chain release factor N(5)-glutamine methyltransferase [Thermaceae bacterium]